MRLQKCTLISSTVHCYTDDFAKVVKEAEANLRSQQKKYEISRASFEAEFKAVNAEVADSIKTTDTVGPARTDLLDNFSTSASHHSTTLYRLLLFVSVHHETKPCYLTLVPIALCRSARLGRRIQWPARARAIRSCKTS